MSKKKPDKPKYQIKLKRLTQEEIDRATMGQYSKRNGVNGSGITTNVDSGKQSMKKNDRSTTKRIDIVEHALKRPLDHNHSDENPEKRVKLNSQFALRRSMRLMEKNEPVSKFNEKKPNETNKKRSKTSQSVERSNEGNIDRVMLPTPTDGQLAKNSNAMTGESMRNELQTSKNNDEEPNGTNEKSSPCRSDESNNDRVKLSTPTDKQLAENSNARKHNQCTVQEVATLHMKVGDIVWAKLSRAPYWPAKIERVYGIKNQMIEVVWFNEYRRSKIHKGQAEDFLLNFKKHVPKFNDFVGLETAAKEATIYAMSIFGRRNLK